MNKSSLLVGVVLGAALSATGAALATLGLAGGASQARVLSVQPITEQVRTPRQECREVSVVRPRPVRDQHQIAGTLLGALAGGLVGNQIGGGNGKKVATVAGAAAGGYAGNKVQENLQANARDTVQETRCQTVMDSHEKQVGYQVRYELDGEVGSVRLQRDPGEFIPVEDGRLVLTGLQ